jgi:hypothetical protein
VVTLHDDIRLYADYMQTAAFARIASKATALLNGRNTGDDEDLTGVLMQAASELGAVLEAPPAGSVITATSRTYTGRIALVREGSEGATIPAVAYRDGNRVATTADGSITLGESEIAYVWAIAWRQSWWDKYGQTVIIIAIAAGAFVTAGILSGAFAAAAPASAVTASATAATVAAPTAAATGGGLASLSAIAGLVATGSGIAIPVIQSARSSEQIESMPNVQEASMLGGLTAPVLGLPLWIWISAAGAAYLLVRK